MHRLRRVALLLSLLSLAALTAGCAVTEANAEVAAFRDVEPEGPAQEVRLGYFANVTHASALYGVEAGTFERALGDTELTTQVFNAGPAAVEALFAGSLDAAYLGPNPTINAFLRSGGAALRIVGGATSGGAALVVQPTITGPEQLRGKVIASPQTAGTQDVALRAWLAEQGMAVDETGAGPAIIRAQENAQTLQEFAAGRIAGAWVPEPWASRLVLEGGGRVLVDEKDLWPGGRFATTHLVVRTEFLRRHPQTVEALLRGQLAAERAIAADPARARAVVNEQLEELTGKRVSPAVLERAFAHIEITQDPLATTLRTSAEHMFATGLVREADLTGIYDLTLLRRVLGRDVDDAGLGDPHAVRAPAPAAGAAAAPTAAPTTAPGTKG